MTEMQTRLEQAHRERYATPGAAFEAPGRVNLIGEHTDYSGGLVMPAAIDFSTIAIISRRDDDGIAIYSSDFDETVTGNTRSLLEKASGKWSDYPFGVLWSLGELGITTGGFNMSIAGNVPLGAGLSSSASIEVAVALALLSLADKPLPLKQVALACQRAENGFVGAQSGIMDQFIACFGEQDHAVMIDCRSLDYTPVPIPPDVRLVICNSMVKHSHAGGEYNQRRAEVDEGTRILHAANPQIQELRDATVADLEAVRASMPDNVYRRCRHIITENKRVEEAARALQTGDLPRVGALMGEAHISYRDDFAASCRECDILVDLANQQPGIIGARLTGGGFGGCTVNLVEAAQAENFRDRMHAAYQAATGIDAQMYLCRASDGAHALDSEPA